MNSEADPASIYSLQDRLLAAVQKSGAGFYLTGGTAAARGYLHHRYSDDLDLFVNNDSRYFLWVENVVAALRNTRDCTVEIAQREERFARLTLHEGELHMKVDLVNDVPSRIGVPMRHAVLGMLDTAENILANKFSALAGRNEPKDLADVWGFCIKMRLSPSEALQNASGKAAGLFPPDIARILASVTEKDWALIRWIHPPDFREYAEGLRSIADRLVLP